MVLGSSLPSRERGLKFAGDDAFLRPFAVAPFTGAWIEIKSMADQKATVGVAPFTGAWIEMSITRKLTCRPSRSLHGSVD